MNCVPLIRVVIDAIAIFSECAGDVVDQDIAIKQLESISSNLQELSPEDKVTFLDYVRQIADQEEAGGASQTRIDFLHTLGENIGLEA